MPQMSLKLKALTCSMLVVGAASLVSVSAAQGEKGANWRVNGVNVNSTLLPEVQVKELESGLGTMLFTTKSGTKVSILCKVIHDLNLKEKADGSFTISKLKALECEIDLNGTKSAPCKPHSAGQPLGTIESTSLTGLMILAEAGVPVASFKPESGTTLATIELGEECAIGETIPVAGQLTVKDCKNEFSVENTEHLVEQGKGTSLTALGQPATLDGSAIVKLGGAHAGLKFSGSPA